MDMILLTPTFGMLHNAKENRWHPIFFVENPLPGPPDASKPLRLRSKGHHTKGFETRAEALASIDGSVKQLNQEVIVDTEKDIEWDGIDIPLAVAFLSNKKLVFL